MSDRVPDSPNETRSGPFVFATAPAIGRSGSEDLTGTFEGHTAWVLDGADDPLADKAKCSHGARWYVHALDKALGESLSQSQPALDVLLQRAIQRVRDAHETECENPLHRKPSATVGIFRSNAKAIDYLVLGDASILLESSDAVVHVTDRRLHRIGQNIRHAILNRLYDGHGFDDPRRLELLQELVGQEQSARNTSAGYPIAAYDPAAAFESFTETLPLDVAALEVKRAALLTDGAERAVSTFGLFDGWRHLIQAASKEGPAECIRKIREAEGRDPSGQQHPRTKFSDDATLTLWTRPHDHPDNASCR